MTVTLDRHGCIAVLTIDNPPVNALKTEIRAQLLSFADELDADSSVSAVVLCGAGKLFVGGADITEFDRPPESPTLPEVIARIEAARIPWVAAIHGAALGGGLELALGCHARVAAANATMGLPEVNLGFIPGAGGTQRLPRLIGLAEAIPVIAERDMMNTARAIATGLVDRVIEGPLVEGAIAFAGDLHTLPAPAASRSLVDPGLTFWEEETQRITKAAKGQTAPLAALSAIRFGAARGAVEGLAHERKTFLTLRDSEESAALRHLFLAERAALRPAALRGIDPRPLDLVGVVGGGTMGSGIAAALRMAGYRVILSERDDQALERGLASVRRIFDAAARKGQTSPEEASARMSGVVGRLGLGALDACDLVVEAVFEDLQVKRAVFSELGAICRPDAILVTNTSYIDPRQIARGLPMPERFLGLHFFSPAHIMKLVEIIPLPETGATVQATVFDLVRRLHKIPVRSGICEGFIGNRILKRARVEAEAMLREGVPHDRIDMAMRGFGFAMGPFEVQDLAGLDISFMNREAARARGEDVPETFGDLLVRAGRNGIKTGAGWYDYAEGDRRPVLSADAARIIAPLMGAPSLPPPETVVARLIGAMAEEGQAILSEGIAASAADIDLVQVHGYGFPRSKGGPMFQSQRRIMP